MDILLQLLDIYIYNKAMYINKGNNIIIYITKKKYQNYMLTYIHIQKNIYKQWQR